VHIILQGIAAGLGARFGSTKTSVKQKHIESAEELLGVLRGSGLPFGVVNERK
jgi:hypothetical protein